MAIHIGRSHNVPSFPICIQTPRSAGENCVAQFIAFYSAGATLRGISQRVRREKSHRAFLVVSARTAVRVPRGTLGRSLLRFCRYRNEVPARHERGSLAIAEKLPSQQFTTRKSMSSGGKPGYADWAAGQLNDTRVVPYEGMCLPWRQQFLLMRIMRRKILKGGAYMLRIGICDDEQDARFTLRCAVERQLEQSDIPYSIYDFSSADGLLPWLCKHTNELDLLFLDIEMPGTNGMEAAAKIREKDTRLQLVFVTGYMDYVFDGYTVGALDYLTKPLNLQRLDRVLRRVWTLIYQHEPETYTIQNADGLFRIPLNHILYFMSDRRQVILVTKTRRFSFYAKLDEVEHQLDSSFVRLHRRYLANLRVIDSMEGDTVRIGDENLPVSRNQKAAVLRGIADFIFSKEESDAGNYVERPY